MGDIVNNIRHVTVLVKEIATAASEQRGGIEQVNQAIAMMDRTTQQNAALVEQSTAATQVLLAEVGLLVTAIQSFRTS